MSNWTHKVVKRARGMNGEYFDFPTAATFSSEAQARKYAEAFAKEQANVGGVLIVVRSRRKVAGEFGRTNAVATYRADYCLPA